MNSLLPRVRMYLLTGYDHPPAQQRTHDIALKKLLQTNNIWRVKWPGSRQYYLLIRVMRRSCGGHGSSLLYSYLWSGLDPWFHQDSCDVSFTNRHVVITLTPTMGLNEIFIHSFIHSFIYSVIPTFCQSINHRRWFFSTKPYKHGSILFQVQPVLHSNYSLG